MNINKGKLLKEIRKKWDSPEKLLDFLMDYEKQEDVEREILRKRVLKETALNYSIAVAYTLNYKFGIGKKRMPKILDQIMFTFDCFSSGHLNIEDCKSELEKIGIRIE